MQREYHGVGGVNVSEKTNLSDVWVKSFFSAFAILTVFYEPLSPSAYEGTVRYLKAVLLQIVDIPNVTFLLVWIALSCLFFFSKNIAEKTWDAQTAGLAGFFSICVLLGQSYEKCASARYCFGGAENVIKFILGFIGYTILFEELILMLFGWLKQKEASEAELSAVSGFWSGNVFLKSGLIMFLAYLPFLVLSFTGNMCWDSEGQIEQVVLGSGYSLHHPIVHTLLMGNIVKLGDVLFHSYNIGLFLYILFQTFMLISALAYTLHTLAKRRLDPLFLRAILIFYCISPVFSNITTTAIKDVPFCAAVVFFVVLLVQLLEDSRTEKRKTIWTAFAFAQAGVILFRNNGLPLVILTDLGCLLYFLLRKKDKKHTIRFTVSSLAAIIAAEALTLLLAAILDAEPGSKGEIFSLPFQQTARYIRYYGDDLEPGEVQAIEKILGDKDSLGGAYDYKIADPVKMHFVKDAEMKDIISYFKVWFRCFFRHPGVYFDAFFVHVYGWFDPMVNNAIRYEMDLEGSIFSKSEAALEIDKILRAFYQFEDQTAPIGILQNVGIAVWALFLLALYQKKSRMDICYRLMNLPLWISVLICMASPCFLLHPRYGFPILFTVPFLWGITILGKRLEKEKS